MMTRVVSGLVALVCLSPCSPAFAGQVVRSVSGDREVVTIVDHGHTRGRPALQGRPSVRRVVAKSTAAISAAQGKPEVIAAPAAEVDVMTAQVLTSMLALQLRSEDTADIPAVGADPTAHELRLVGAVPNERARITVAEQAMEIAGVGTLRNELQLFDWAPSAYLIFDDEHVQERVERALLAWPELHAADIEVAVDQGVTTLSGSVATADQRVLASTAAASAAGVYLVQNRLSLLPD